MTESPRQPLGHGRITASRQQWQRYLPKETSKRNISTKVWKVVGGMAVILLLATVGYALASLYKKQTRLLIGGGETNEGGEDGGFQPLTTPKPKVEKPADPSAEVSSAGCEPEKDAENPAGDAKEQVEKPAESSAEVSFAKHEPKEAEEDPYTAYTHATKATTGKRPSSENSGTFLVYFYEKEVLRTYEMLIIVDRKATPPRRSKRWRPVGEENGTPLEKEPEPLAKSPCVLWLDMEKKELFFEFHTNVSKGPWGNSNTASVSPSEKDFGPEPRVYETWKQLTRDTKSVVSPNERPDPSVEPGLTHEQEVQKERDAANTNQQENVEEKASKLAGKAADLVQAVTTPTAEEKDPEPKEEKAPKKRKDSAKDGKKKPQKKKS